MASAALLPGKFLSTPSARRATPTAVCDERSQTISIHALREEGDGCHQFSPPRDTLFLSTPSVRRATGTLFTPSYALRISIHALREEGDRLIFLCGQSRNYFYPRPP